MPAARPGRGNGSAACRNKLRHRWATMQSHDNDRSKQGADRGADQGPEKQHESESDLGSDDPAPRMVPDAPAAGAVQQQVSASDTRGRSLGNFLLTHYTFALESDPKHAGSPKVTAPGLPKDKKYRQSFLGSPYGIKMQGTGLADDGQYIRYVGKGTYAYGVGGAKGTPHAWKTVAVDPSVIKLGSHIEIEAYKSKGIFEANDTGGAIKGKHIDVFAGAIPIAQAYALGTKHSEVFLSSGSGGKADDGKDTKDTKDDQKDTQSGNGPKPDDTKHTGGKDQYKPAPSLEDVRAGKGVVKRGMEGPAVAFVQKKVGVTADSQFGPKTEAAVKKYQSAHSLVADGVVGKLTIAAMDGHAGSTPDTGKGNTGNTDTGGKGNDTGGKGNDTGEHPQATGEAQVRDEVLAKARTHLNAPYSWGAQGPSMFDCSGFSWYVLHTDTHLTDKGRTNADGLSRAPYTTSISEPEKGDLVFYASGGHINHVTIALGSGSQTIGASGGGSQTHGDNPNAKVKVTDWARDKRTKSFGSIKKLIENRLHAKK